MKHIFGPGLFYIPPTFLLSWKRNITTNLGCFYGVKLFIYTKVFKYQSDVMKSCLLSWYVLIRGMKWPEINCMENNFKPFSVFVENNISINIWTEFSNNLVDQA